MDREEKLAMARRKLKKFQSRNSPQVLHKSSGASLSSESTDINSSKTSLPTPTLVGALPSINNHLPSVQQLSLAVPSSVGNSFLNGLSYSLPSRSTLAPPSSTGSSTHHSSSSSAHNSSPSRPAHSQSSSTQHTSLAPAIDLVPPLTSLSGSPSVPHSPINYSLPNLMGGASGREGKVQPTTTHAYLNGSILDHLNPSSAAPPPDLKIEPPLTKSDPPPPLYDASRKGVAVVPANKPSSAGPRKGASLPSGASQGGVLLRHIPYLPSEAGMLGVGSGAGPTLTESEGVLAGGGSKGGGSERSEVTLTTTRDSSAEETSNEGEEIVDLEQKIRAHAQTIDILVSEKATLQEELGSLKSQLSRKSKECLDWDSHTKTTRQKLSDLEKEHLATSAELSGRREEAKQSQLENAKLSKTLERLRASLEDQQQESTELISKVTAQSAELMQLQNANTELLSKLNMAELLTQQLSGGKPVEATPTDPALLKRLQEAEDQVKQLQRNLESTVREKDQVNSDLSVLQDSMAQQRTESTRKFSEYQAREVETEDKISAMKNEMKELLLQKEVLEKKLCTEHAQSEHSSHVAMETIQQERDQLSVQLEKQVQENIQLVKTNTQLESHALEAELRLSRLQEQSVDHQHLLTTMAQDKETLSRAMSQNKELKRNNAELQDAFVKLSHQNMDLASGMDTEKRRVAYLRTQLDTPTLVQPTTPTPVVELKMTSIPPQHIASSLTETTPTSVLEDTPTSVGSADSASEAGGPSRGGGAAESAISQEEAAEKQQQINVLLLENNNLRDQIQQLQEVKGLNLPPTAEVATPTPEEATPTTEVTLPTAEVAPSEDMEMEVEQTDTGDAGTSTIFHQQRLQESFDALQWRFVSVMREKADLKEENEVVMLKMSKEAKAIAYLIEAFKSKTWEKDKCIQQLMSEKSAMQTNFAQLQVLVRKVLAEKAALTPPQAQHRPSKPAPPLLPSPLPTSHHSTPIRQPLGNFAESTSIESMGIEPRMSVQFAESTESTNIPFAESTNIPFAESANIPFAESTTDIPFHLRPQSRLDRSDPTDTDVDSGDGNPDIDSGDGNPDVDSGDGSPNSLLVDSSHRIEDESQVNTATAEQIMELLDQLEVDSNVPDTAVPDVLAQCSHCTGELLVV